MITSAHNPKIQRVRALLSRRHEREAAGVFVIEGVRLVEEARGAGWQAELVLHTGALSARGQALLDGFRQTGSEVEEIPEHLMDAISGTEAPQGILAVVQRRTLPLPERLDFALITDSVRDPGNLGTLLRTAAAAGVGAVLLAPGTTDAFAPKVLRAGMGAHFRLPVIEAGWEQIRAICKDRPDGRALGIYLAEAEEGVSCWALDLRQPVALVVGAEAEGVTPAARAAADGLITIPMPGQSESLNAAIAASILLFEVVRQRNIPPP
jgi:TrmH family RNA methyltransferase